MHYEGLPVTGANIIDFFRAKGVTPTEVHVFSKRTAAAAAAAHDDEAFEEAAEGVVCFQTAEEVAMFCATVRSLRELDRWGLVSWESRAGRHNVQ